MPASPGPPTSVATLTVSTPAPAPRAAPVPSLPASPLSAATAVLGLSLCLFCPLDGVPEDPSVLATCKAQTHPAQVLRASLGLQSSRCMDDPGVFVLC